MQRNDLKRDKRFRKHLARELQVEQPPESYLKAVRAALDDLPDELPVKRRPFYQSALRACAAFAAFLLVAAVGVYGAYLANPVFVESLPGVGQIFQELDREDQPTPSPDPWDQESHVNQEQEALEEIPPFEPQTLVGGGGTLIVQDAWCDGLYLHMEAELYLEDQENPPLSTYADLYDPSTDTLAVYVDGQQAESLGESALFAQKGDDLYSVSWIFQLPEERGHGDTLDVTLDMPRLTNSSGDNLTTDIYGGFPVTVDTSRSLIQDLETEDNGITLKRVEATPSCITIQAAVPEFGSLASTMMLPYSQLDQAAQRLGYYGQLTTPDGEILSESPYPFSNFTSYPDLPADDGLYHVTYTFQALPEGVGQAIFTLYEYPPATVSSNGENPASNRVTAEFTIDLGTRRVYASQNYLAAGRKKLDYRISADIDRTPDPVNGYICPMPDTSENFTTWCLYTRDTEYRPVELHRYENEELAAVYTSAPEEEYNAYAEGFSVYQGNQHLFREAHLDSLDLGGTWNVLLFQLYDTENSDFFYNSPATRYELVDGETGEVLIQDVFRAFCQQYDQVFGTRMEDSRYGEDSAGDVSDVEQTTDEVSTASPLPR